MMKYLLLLSLLNLSLGYHLALAQVPDTIRVSHQGKSYLLFDHPVSLVDVGNPSWYEARIEGHAVMVVARKDSVPMTPIYAVVDGKPFTGMLSFHPIPFPFYDFRKADPPEGLSKVGVSTAQWQERLQSMQAQRDLNYAHQKEGGVTFRLVGLMHDLSATYLKFKVSNQSSVVYRTDFIGFERKQRYRKGFFAKEQEATFPMTPLATGKVSHVLPYSEEYLYYALPLWAPGPKDKLLATLRESNGSRTLTLKIPPRLIRKADLF